MAEVVAGAIGGVIFLDEAHRLMSNIEYGKQALQAVQSAIDKNSTVFIFGGYEKEMEKMFKELDAGFGRRIKNKFKCVPYSTNELQQVLQRFYALPLRMLSSHMFLQDISGKDTRKIIFSFT